jgi:Flp pilus assembly protein TadG
MAPGAGRVRRRGTGDRGSFALELVVAAPALLVLIAFVISVGRVTEGRALVQGAARDAARAATINHAGNAERAAREAFSRATAGMNCDGLALDPAQPGPDMQVTATVRCTVSTMWGRQTIVRTAQSVTDRYRSVD